MTTPRFTQRQIRTGRSVLASLLTETRNAAKTENGTKMQAVSEEGKAQMPNLRTNNLDAVIITPKDGGFVADFLLKKVSPLQNDVFGSPDHMPLPTHADAIAWVQLFLKCLVSIETATKA